MRPRRPPVPHRLGASFLIPRFLFELRLEFLAEFDAEIHGFDGIDAVILIAVGKCALGDTAELTLFVEQILDVPLQVPVILAGTCR